MQTRKYDEFGAVFLEPGGTPLKARLILFAATMFLLSAPASAQQGVVDLSSAAPTRVEHRDDGLIIMNYDLPESSRNPRAKSVFTYIVFTSPEPPGLNPIVTLNIAPPEFIPHYYTLAVGEFRKQNCYRKRHPETHRSCQMDSKIPELNRPGFRIRCIRIPSTTAE